MLLSEIAAEARRAVPGGLAAFSFEERAERPRPWHKMLQKGKIKAGSSRGRPGKEQAAKLRLAAVPRVWGKKLPKKVRSKLRSFYYFIFFPQISAAQSSEGGFFFFFSKAPPCLPNRGRILTRAVATGRKKKFLGRKAALRCGVRGTKVSATRHR